MTESALWGMTNDETRMANQLTKSECSNDETKAARADICFNDIPTFVIRTSSLIRHSGFVIRHSPNYHPDDERHRHPSSFRPDLR